MDKVTQIEQHLQTCNFFPGDACIWETGKPVYEFPFIQKISDNKFIVHSQRHYALNPFMLAEKAEWSFENLRDAYKKWYNLENRIF